jgi:hypothetical protein
MVDLAEIERHSRMIARPVGFPYPMICTGNDGTVLPTICRVVDCSDPNEAINDCVNVCGAARGGSFESQCFLFDVCTP